jgi:hypothetical protein
MDEFWSYSGSLTTPPCTEGIKWSVLKNVQPISNAQLVKFTSLWAGNSAYAAGKGNNRAIQLLNGRTVYDSDMSETTPTNVSSIVLAILLALTLVALIAVVIIMKICPGKFCLEKLGSKNREELESMSGHQMLASDSAKHLPS